jgi:hypothetical protein
VNFDDCTLENYKKMADFGAITFISHGAPGEHHAVYAPLSPAGKAACDAWRGQEQGMTTQTNWHWVNQTTVDTNKSYYSVAVDTTWLTANWKQKLDDNYAIVMWSTCYSASNCPNAQISVKEAAGGRWRSGYELETNADEARDVNEAFIKRMNGTVVNGKLRIAGSAYNDPTINYRQIDTYWFRVFDANGNFVNWRHVGSVKMDGDWWTTLCPAPLEINPVYPAWPVSDKRKGFGCILFDTTLDGTSSATDALTKESGGAGIMETYWLKDTNAKFYGLGFVFDKTTDNTQTTMKAISNQIKNEGTEGRQMDGDRVQPNDDDRQWSY